MKKNPRILITAGPTIEPIDPVRFISNRSTGHLGYELARNAKNRKFKVTLISGPTTLKPPRGVKFVRIRTARELKRKMLAELAKSDILVMASAVSDFRPLYFSKKKLKSRGTLTLKLAKNPDILRSIPRNLRKNKIIIGFSLETEDLLKNAAQKLRNKHMDLIVANKCDRKNTPFGKGLKTVYLLDALGHLKILKKQSKRRIARAILDTIRELCYTPK